jgi:peptidoglycan/xylan/chitin deacetylase (PgdA/CDA1 family)
MHTLKNALFSSLAVVLFMFAPIAMGDQSQNVPILVYHNFEPETPGSMTINTAKFEQQIKWLKDNGYTVIPLQDLVSYLRGDRSSLPDKSVVITADDGRITVYKYMLPIVKKYNIPVTLFIYPSSISNASYAMTWKQLKELQQTGLFDIQGHTYWHPNFKQEKKRLSAEEYDKFVQTQLVTSKKIINDKLGTNVTLLAWPHGIYDANLEQAAAKAGYVMAFSIDARPANRSENDMSQPRYMVLQPQSMQTFINMVNGKVLGKVKN